MDIHDILAGVKTIAVIGLSTDEAKAGYYVPEYLHDAGFRIIPVNPRVTEIWGEIGYASLRDIPDPVDLVLVFRRAEYVPEVAREALALASPPRVIWLQSGIVSPEARALAEAAGVRYVENRCLMVEYRRMSED